MKLSFALAHLAVRADEFILIEATRRLPPPPKVPTFTQDTVRPERGELTCVNR